MSLSLSRAVNRLKGCTCQILRYSTLVENKPNNEVISEKQSNTIPIISRITYKDEKQMFHKPREVWIENLDTVEGKKLGLITLHPDVYAAQPRIDVIHQNARWQKMYRFVSYAHTRTRAEFRGGNRKPWPQKGMGKARHGSIRSPLWIGGGVAHGPRSPTPHFYMLPFYTRVCGLTATLSVKLAQDDLHIVDNLEIPSDQQSYIEELIEERNWGPSVLFVDSDDIMPQNIAIATDTLKPVNLMPVYGLNVYSMLKHETLVLTTKAARLIEDKLLYQLNRSDPLKVQTEFKVDQH